MKTWIVGMAVAFLLALLSASALAHLSYCGHARAFNANGTIMERYEGESFGLGHVHQYTAFKQYPNGSWHVTHTHFRTCKH